MMRQSATNNKVLKSQVGAMRSRELLRSRLIESTGSSISAVIRDFENYRNVACSIMEMLKI